MAKYGEGVNYTKQNDPVSATNIIDHGLLYGKLRVMQDTYTFGATSLNSQDYILVGGKLPTGAQVVSMLLTMGSPDTSSSPVSVGDEGDENRYLTSTAVNAGAVQVCPNVVGGMYYTVTGTTDNYIRIAGASAATVLSGASVKISVMYIVE